MTCGIPWPACCKGLETSNLTLISCQPDFLSRRRSTAAPGAYNITYVVTNSRGVAGSTWRQLTVRAGCLPGEALCPDRVRNCARVC